MPRKKLTKYDKLRKLIVADMEERGCYREIDSHLIDAYIAQVKIIDGLLLEIESDGVVTQGERSDKEFVANPALVRLPSAQSALQAMAKQLGIGPYGRKLTTGQETKSKTTATKVSQLKPRVRGKAN